jgi:two-component system sensor histidine kinase KdpD
MLRTSSFVVLASPAGGASCAGLDLFGPVASAKLPVGASMKPANAELPRSTRVTDEIGPFRADDHARVAPLRGILAGLSPGAVLRAMAGASLRARWRAPAWVFASVFVCSAVGLVFERHFEPAVVAMTYLAGVIATASRLTVGAAALSAAVHALAYDYFFIPPRFEFEVPDIKSWITLLVMMLVGAVLASSLRQARDQERFAQLRASIASSMYLLLRELCVASSAEQIDLITSRHVERMVGGRARVVAASAVGSDVPFTSLDEADRDALHAAWSSLEPVVGKRRGPETTFCIPMVVMQRVTRVLLVKTRLDPSLSMNETLQLLEHSAQQGAAAFERVGLEHETHRAQLAAETEQMRSTLLAAVSHDVRTPLTSIKAAAETMAGRAPALASEQISELASVIVGETDSLIRLVNNILNLTRIEAGSLSPNKMDTPVEDLVSKAIERVGRDAQGRRIRFESPDDLLLASVDPILMEQVLANVLDNAIKYTPPESEITISAADEDGAIVVRIEDEGPGFSDDEETRVLEKFVRGRASHRSAGLGLGLSICRAIMLAHGGAIRLGNRESGGASVSLKMPAGHGVRVAIDERTFA